MNRFTSSYMLIYILYLIIVLIFAILSDAHSNSSCYDDSGSYRRGDSTTCRFDISTTRPIGMYLVGDYIQVALNPEGSLGVKSSVPVRFKFPSTRKLGLLSDFDSNGFYNLPKPSYAGDYILPGFPYEGMLIILTYIPRFIN